MKRTILLFLTLTLTTAVTAQNSVNLDSLYQVLDLAIDSSKVYQKQKTDALEALRQRFLAANDDMARYQYANSLFQGYTAFNNDSALSYLQRCIDYADKMGRRDLKTQSELALARQLAESGFYMEAEYHFNAIPKEYLKGDQLEFYLLGLNYLYGELGYYSHDQKLSQAYHAKAQAICDTLFSILPEDSRNYIFLKTMQLNNSNQLGQALQYNDHWRAIVKPGTRDYALMSFYRSEIYKNIDDVDNQRYWLIQSALTDIRLAINDQSALWSLANSLMQEEGNLDRAYKYMDFSWVCISRFSTHMRSWLVSPILTRINDQYKNSLNSTNTRLTWAIAIISLLLVGLVVSLLYVSRKRKQLAVARNELSDTNSQLKDMNERLSDLNVQLFTVNSHLKDSNRVKDEYITRFLQLCSEYIDKLDNYRIKINRKVKANQFDDIKKMTSSQQMKEDELKELFDNFDKVFLRLFPNFVSDFNALLKPDERIVLPEENKLNTDLRIFALIRLGIDESSRIADFLRYSPNSIYNYRARIKNKAIGDRDDFERCVKEIGILH